MTADVYLGLVDWGASAPDLYPDELPEEWREAYYTTKFSCVWLSRAAVDALVPGEAERWLAEVPEFFRFVCEEDRVPDALKARSVVASGNEIWFDAGTDLANLAETLRLRLESESVIFLLSRDANQTRADQVRTLMELLGL